MLKPADTCFSFANKKKIMTDIKTEQRKGVHDKRQGFGVFLLQKKRLTLEQYTS